MKKCLKKAIEIAKLLLILVRLIKQLLDCI